MTPATPVMLPRPARVARVQRETDDTVTLTLDLAADAPAFAPGQFNMLYAPAVGEVAISMSGDPARRETVHTIRAVGAVTRALCGLRRGAMLGVRGPFGRAWPVDEAAGGDLVVVAGGLGLAPLRSAVYAALARRKDFGHVALLVGARTPEDLIFRRDLARWTARGDVAVHTTVDRAGPAWRGHVGVVTDLLPGARLDPARATVLVCGPEIMMRATVRELLRRGVPEARIHVSLERNMKCAVGLCGHCQFGPAFVCKDGPVFAFDRIRSLFWMREV